MMETHWAKLMHKLHLHSMADLIRYVLRHHIAAPSKAIVALFDIYSKFPGQIQAIPVVGSLAAIRETS
jgi:hypothetical protein